MKTTFRFSIAFIFAILSLPVVLFAQRSITVSGIGSVTAKPDYAIITLMLTSQNNTAQTVFSQSDENSSRMMKSLSDAGVAPEALAFGIETFDLHQFRCIARKRKTCRRRQNCEGNHPFENGPAAVKRIVALHRHVVLHHTLPSSTGAAR